MSSAKAALESDTRVGSIFPAASKFAPLFHHVEFIESYLCLCRYWHLKLQEKPKSESIQSLQVLIISYTLQISDLV